MDWMLLRRPTTRTETLVDQLTELAGEIDASCIVLASPAARVEWMVLREMWPTLADVRAGLVYLSDDALELMISRSGAFTPSCFEGEARTAIRCGLSAAPGVAAAARSRHGGC